MGGLYPEPLHTITQSQVQCFLWNRLCCRRLEQRLSVTGVRRVSAYELPSYPTWRLAISDCLGQARATRQIEPVQPQLRARRRQQP